MAVSAFIRAPRIIGLVMKVNVNISSCARKPVYGLSRSSSFGPGRRGVVGYSGITRASSQRRQRFISTGTRRAASLGSEAETAVTESREHKFGIDVAEREVLSKDAWMERADAHRAR